MKCVHEGCKQDPCYDDAAWHMQVKNHTPLPWHIELDLHGYSIWGGRTSREIDRVANLCGDKDFDPIANANAKLIVDAVNMYGELFKAAKREDTKMKTQTPHTPGPWEIRHYDGPLLHGNVISANGKDLCVLNCSESNARLIAAAPELLELIKIQIESMNRAGEHLNYSGMEWKRKAEQAIAKAEGRE